MAASPRCPSSRQPHRGFLRMRRILKQNTSPEEARSAVSKGGPALLRLPIFETALTRLPQDEADIETKHLTLRRRGAPSRRAAGAAKLCILRAAVDAASSDAVLLFWREGRRSGHRIGVALAWAGLLPSSSGFF